MGGTDQSLSQHGSRGRGKPLVRAALVLSPTGTAAWIGYQTTVPQSSCGVFGCHLVELVAYGVLLVAASAAALVCMLFAVSRRRLGLFVTAVVLIGGPLVAMTAGQGVGRWIEVATASAVGGWMSMSVSTKVAAWTPADAARRWAATCHLRASDGSPVRVDARGTALASWPWPGADVHVIVRRSDDLELVVGDTRYRAVSGNSFRYQDVGGLFVDEFDSVERVAGTGGPETIRLRVVWSCGTARPDAGPVGFADAPAELSH
jgi:hypothetical protein